MNINEYNNDLYDLLKSCEKEIKNHNPTPRTVCVVLQRLIEEKRISNIFDLYNLIEDKPKEFLRECHFGRVSFKYLKEKMYSMFKFKTIVQVERI